MKTAAEWQIEKDAASAAHAKRPTFETYMRCDQAIRMLAAARLREGRNV